MLDTKYFTEYAIRPYSLFNEKNHDVLDRLQFEIGMK